MMMFFFRGANGDYLSAEAESEHVARCKVMVARWGSLPDAIVPYAPRYLGSGLIRCDESGMAL